MLSVRLICVGKLGEKFWAEAVKEYTKRLAAYCKLEIIELPEQRLPQSPSQGEIGQALDKEAAMIEAKIPQGAAVIALCDEGRTAEQLRLLAEQRRELLDRVHADERRIDCLDYLIYSIKNKKYAL